MLFKSIVVGPMQVNAFVLACERTKKGIVIDPGENVPGILELVREDDIDIVEVVATHGHIDHIARATSLVSELGGVPFVIHPDDDFLVEHLEDAGRLFGIPTDPPPAIDRHINEGDTVTFGDEPLNVIHTPGHCPGNITLLWEGHAIVGDVLFAGSVGRTDLPGGDSEVLMRSIRERLLPLPDDTEVYPGHGSFTTIGHERATNPFIVGN